MIGHVVLLFAEFCSAKLRFLGLFQLARQQRFEVAWFLTLSAMILISPVSWLHIFPLLVPILIQSAANPAHPTTRIVGMLGLLAGALPDVFILRGLLMSLGGSKIPVSLFFLLKAPTWWLLTFCRSLVGTPRTGAKS